jgi:hypothetical protein
MVQPSAAAMGLNQRIFELLLAENGLTKATTSTSQLDWTVSILKAAQCRIQAAKSSVRAGLKMELSYVVSSSGLLGAHTSPSKIVWKLDEVKLFNREKRTASSSSTSDILQTSHQAEMGGGPY